MRRIQAQKDPGEIEDLPFHDFETAWTVWIMLEATGWKWPPDVLLRQDGALMSDIMSISMVAHQIEEQERG